MKLIDFRFLEWKRGFLCLSSQKVFLNAHGGTKVSEKEDLLCFRQDKSHFDALANVEISKFERSASVFDYVRSNSEKGLNGCKWVWLIPWTVCDKNILKCKFLLHSLFF